MLDWLRRDPHREPALDVAGRSVPIVLRRMERARRMTMRLAPDGSEIRITVPRWVRTADALQFASSRRDWLERQLIALPEQIVIAHGQTVHYRGHPLVLHHDAGAARRPVRHEHTLAVGGPEASLQARLRRWLQAEALELMADDLAAYCERAEKPAPALALSNARRRWGSCAPDGTIRINWRLIMAPDAVRRSVVAHEVAHLVHFDHSPAFHRCLDGLFEGSIAEANHWLKRHGRELYLPFG